MMTDVEMGIAINSANPWFILFYTPVFVSEWDELASSDDKERMIEKIYDVFTKQVGLKHLSKKTVRTSVNALVNIISGGRTIDALDYVMESQKLYREYPEVWHEAAEFIEEVADGKYDDFQIPLFKVKDHFCNNKRLL